MGWLLRNLLLNEWAICLNEYIKKPNEWTIHLVNEYNLPKIWISQSTEISMKLQNMTTKNLQNFQIRRS